MHLSSHMCTFAHTIFGKTKSKYQRSSLSSAKMFYICCLFSFQRTGVLNVVGAKPTPTQLQMNTVALWISYEGWRKQLIKVFNLTTAWSRGKKHSPKENYQVMFFWTLEILLLCKLCFYHSVISWGIAFLSFLLQSRK